MPAFAAPRPKAREETPEEKAAWLAMRAHINDLGLIEDQLFDLPGVITSITGSPDDPNKPIWKKVKNRKTGSEEDQAFLTITVKLSDPKFAALTIRKDMRISFFDGYLRGQDNRSPFRGAFYHVYRAATGKEPPSGIVNGTQEFDPSDWCNIPMRVFFLYQGRVKEGEDYYGTRANLKVWLDHFEPTVETIRKARGQQDDDGYGQDEPPFSSPTPTAAHTTSTTAPTTPAGSGANATPTDPFAAMAEAMGITVEELQARLNPIGNEKARKPKKVAEPEGADADALGLPV